MCCDVAELPGAVVKYAVVNSEASSFEGMGGAHITGLKNKIGLFAFLA